MQKLIFCTVVLFLASVAITNVTAQESTFPKNEIKTNLLSDLLGFGVLTYERLLNEESGVGLTVGAIFASDPATYSSASATIFAATDVAFTIQPAYRYYFGKKPAAGYFIEGAGILLIPQEEGALGGVGLTLGAKILTKKNLVVEGFFGLGRLFVELGNDDFFGSLLYPRGGISVGKRF